MRGQLDNVALPAGALLGEIHQGWAPLSRVIGRATVALAAEMRGGAQQMLDMTAAYAKHPRSPLATPPGTANALPY